MKQSRPLLVVWLCLLLSGTASTIALYAGVRQPDGYVAITDLQGLEAFCGLRLPRGTELLQCRYAVAGGDDMQGAASSVLAELRLPPGAASRFLRAAPFSGKADASYNPWHTLGADGRWYSDDPWVRDTVGIRTWRAGAARRFLHADTHLRSAPLRRPFVEALVDLDDPGSPVLYLDADR